MTNEQNHAARKIFNPHRATVGMRSAPNGDGSETITLYLLATPSSASSPVTITRETPTGEVSRLFSTAVRSIL